MKNNREKNRVIFDYLSNNTEMVIQFDKKINKLMKPKKQQKPIKKKLVSKIFRKISDIKIRKYFIML